MTDTNPQPAERDYYVRATVTGVYRVRAESPEDAAQAVEDGDGGEWNVEDSEIVAVTLGPDDEGDLRSDHPCAGGCGTLIRPTRAWCTPCALKPYERRKAS